MTILYTRWRFDTKSEFNVAKNRETLFTFKLRRAELLSF